MHLSEVNKAIINVLTLVVAVGTPLASLLNSDLVPAKVGVVVGGVVAVAGAVLHYFVPNTTTDPRVAATESVRLKPQLKPPPNITPPPVGQPHGPLT